MRYLRKMAECYKCEVAELMPANGVSYKNKQSEAMDEEEELPSSHQMSYRQGMRVDEVRVIRSSGYGETGYYVCPRCHITMEREFMSFCDRCGQKLDWRGYKKARVIYPGHR